MFQCMHHAFGEQINTNSGTDHKQRFLLTVSRLSRWEDAESAQWPGVKREKKRQIKQSEGGGGRKNRKGARVERYTYGKYFS